MYNIKNLTVKTIPTV